MRSSGLVALFLARAMILLWGISPRLGLVSQLQDLFREEQATQFKPGRHREGGAEAFLLCFTLGGCQAGARVAVFPTQERSCLRM